MKNWTLPFNWKRLRWHILFWLLVVAYQIIYFGRLTNEYFDTFLAFIPTFPFDMLATYFSVYFLLPRFLLRKKYFLFALWLILFSIPIIFIELVIGYYIQGPLLIPNLELDMSFFRLDRFVNVFISIYSITLLATAIKLIKLWFNYQQEKTLLKTQSLTSELALLRSQINPHFLFNTLNNIDSLVSINPEKASNSIIKLSEIMRYMLYDANVDFVPLDKEIEYLESFVSLQQLRLKNQKFIDFKVDGDIKNKKIPPMLIIPFVENAFKHGRKNVKAPGVIIDIKISSNTYIFEIVNYVSASGTQEKDAIGGIGLQNNKRRLELLYKDKYELDVSVVDNRYRVLLKISYK